MNDHIGGFNMDSFGGNNSYERTQQRFNPPRGPAHPTYDPSRMGSAASPQQPQQQQQQHQQQQQQQMMNNAYLSSQTNNYGNTHRTLMPASSAGNTGGLAPPLVMQQLMNFDPVPISATTLQRMNISRQVNLIQNHQQQVTTQQHQSQQLLQQQQQHHHQQQQQQQHRHHQKQQQQQQSAMMMASRTQSRSSAPSQSMFPPMPLSISSSSPLHEKEPVKPTSDPLLDELRVNVSNLSLEPMSGSDLLNRIETRYGEVTTRYLPCVDFLVQCQQELRTGLKVATVKRVVHRVIRDAMTPLQFYNTYIANLPQRFFEKNRNTMDRTDVDSAVSDLRDLCGNAKRAERQGCESVKNTFLGGMKDGESWGLRKWLSKHGGALMICNDSEGVLLSCQKLDRSLDSTRRLGERLRPIAKTALSKLKAEVPPSYQEHSTAHPYLPFFHRLEAALKSMSNFDPEDDDVICIDDDDEVEELMAKPPPIKKDASNGSKRKKESPTPTHLQAEKRYKSESSSDSSDEPYLGLLDLNTTNATSDNKTAVMVSIEIDTPDDDAYVRELLKTFDDDHPSDDFFGGTSPDFDSITLPIPAKKGSDGMVNRICRLAQLFEVDRSNLVRPGNISKKGFWDQPLKYASALRLFADILRDPDAYFLLDTAEMTSVCIPPYTSVIRHPISFGEITTALVEDSDDNTHTIVGNDGRLTSVGLSSWNMWHGFDLLHAIDLVLLNSLAYGKATNEGRFSDRSKTNKVRKILWTGIRDVVETSFGAHEQDEKKKCTPTRRGESSGFVVLKDK